MAAWRSSKRANVLLMEAAFALKGANVTLESGWRLIFCLIRVSFKHFNVNQYDFSILVLSAFFMTLNVKLGHGTV